MNDLTRQPSKLFLVCKLALCFYLMPLNLMAESEDLGFSGMAKIDGQNYLVVHDTKSFQDGNRIGKLHIEPGKNPAYSRIDVPDWHHEDGRSNDLESACALPATKNQFLIAESGYWQGKFGRIFHIELQGNTATVIHIYPLPKLIGNSEENPFGDNFEGLACTRLQDNILVVIGERGGTHVYKNGLLRFGLLDLEKTSLSWKVFPTSELDVIAPGQWVDPDHKRSISDLYFDESGHLWAAATADGGDDGPFRSIIYQPATLDLKNSSVPLKLNKNTRATWVLDGVKVEALSGPSSVINDAVLSFATEDENYSGIWRPLFKPVE